MTVNKTIFKWFSNSISSRTIKTYIIAPRGYIYARPPISERLANFQNGLFKSVLWAREANTKIYLSTPLVWFEIIVAKELRTFYANDLLLWFQIYFANFKITRRKILIRPSSVEHRADIRLMVSHLGCFGWLVCVTPIGKGFLNGCFFQ